VRAGWGVGAALALAVLASGLGPWGHAAAAAPRYDCTFDGSNDAYTGAYGTASAIGWEGNGQGVVTCLGGTFLVQDGVDRDYGFGIYDGARTTWRDADGYFPAQVTTFRRGGATVSITELADRVVLGGDPFVAVYARVAVHNPTDRPVVADPDPSPGLVPLDAAPDTVPPHRTVRHDYVVAADRFGGDEPWPSAATLAAAGGFDRHFAHMRDFWDRQLAGIARVSVPDPSLVDAYRAGFIETQIARSGDNLDTGVNGYDRRYSHDTVGILTNLFTQGYFTDAATLLLSTRDAVGSTPTGYADGLWTYPVPWAVYLMKTGDTALVAQNFATGGPGGAAQPSIEDAAHAVAADRTGPSGTMEATDDIDTEGYWTTDNFEALLGLAAYRYIARRLGDTAEAAWAGREYASLLSATDHVLGATIARYHLHYLPCSLLEPDTANRCAHPEDANWASPLGDWAWVAPLLGSPARGPGATMIDATYAFGFGRLRGRLPAGTFGGFPDDYYSSAYNAAYGTAGLAGTRYRDQGILSYEFMIEHSQSGPYSWWESSTAPSATTPWVGRHPAAGQGSSPHAWGMAGANRVLLDSLVAQRADGDLVVGRGVPASWLAAGRRISVDGFPAAGGRRLDLAVTSTGSAVTLHLGGALPPGRVLFQLPSFVDNVAGTTAGRVDEAAGTVSLAPGTRRVTVTLRRTRPNTVQLRSPWCSLGGCPAPDG
jgi:hypothetical protein